MTEKIRRLQPTRETLRKLFLFSGNLCAFPDCHELMMDAEGRFIGQVCHIEAAEPGGERFNPNSSNEERREFDNLMLMCYKHHVETNDTSRFTVTRLKEIKATHEGRFSDPAQAILLTIKDWTRVRGMTRPSNLRRFSEVLELDLDDEQLAEMVVELNTYLNKFCKVPDRTRKFLGEVARRAKYMLTSHAAESDHSGTRLLASDIVGALRIGPQTLRTEIASLEAYALGYLDHVFISGRDEHAVRLYSLGSGWEPWIELVEFCDRAGVELDLLVIDLDFAQLDGDRSLA